MYDWSGWRLPPLATLPQAWRMPLREIEAENNGIVHLWLLSQVQPADCVAQLAASLSDDERDRASKFYTLDLHNRYVVVRGALRHLLAATLSLDPAAIQFTTIANGKPILAVEAHPETLHFNVSHSGDLALIAISRERPLGVDIEAMRPLPDMQPVAAHHFSAAEQATLFNLPPSRQLAGFYNCWTRKEAFIKVDGRGLQIPLDSFDVTLAPDAAPHITRVDDNESPRYTLHNIAVPAGYRAALCYRGYALSLWHHLLHLNHL